MRWRGFKCLDRHLCLARNLSPDSVGAPPMRFHVSQFPICRIGLPPAHTRLGVCLLPGSGRQPTLCLPGPPLGGSEGIGFPEQGDGNPLYTRMEILTLQKGGVVQGARSLFFTKCPFAGAEGTPLFRGTRGGL